MFEDKIFNALTVDVEDYFHVNAFKKYINTNEWDSYPVRVEDNTMKILETLDEFSVKATFFILGWVTEKCPSIIREIQGRGHEIACHGHGHQLVYDMGPEKFREDIRRAKGVLEEMTGKKVNGYRAPTYSITKKSLWALDILIEEGWQVDLVDICIIVH